MKALTLWVRVVADWRRSVITTKGSLFAEVFCWYLIGFMLGATGAKIDAANATPRKQPVAKVQDAGDAYYTPDAGDLYYSTARKPAGYLWEPYQLVVEQPGRSGYVMVVSDGAWAPAIHCEVDEVWRTGRVHWGGSNSTFLPDGGIPIRGFGFCDVVGAPCSPGQTRCYQGCVDMKTDPVNCGVCGSACGFSHDCVAGACR